MKWTVVRRKMVPYVRTKNRFRFNYKNLFYTKQQLKNFYGGLREYKLRNIFKKTWNVELFYRRNIFIGALEQRLNMVLFRMRLLPTIFASTQYIMHKGIYVNNDLITLPSYRVRIGAIVSIPQDQWFIFYKFLYSTTFDFFPLIIFNAFSWLSPNWYLFVLILGSTYLSKNWKKLSIYKAWRIFL